MYDRLFTYGQQFLYTVSRERHVTCYTFDAQNRFWHFGRRVNEPAENQRIRYFPASLLTLLHYLAKQETRKLHHHQNAVWCLITREQNVENSFTFSDRKKTERGIYR